MNSQDRGVPKPDPSIWMRPDELQKVKVSPYLCHGWNERDKQSDAIPLYTYSPDAQAEIDRLKSENTEMARLLSTRVEAARLDEKQDEIDALNAKATEREAFIERQGEQK